LFLHIWLQLSFQLFNQIYFFSTDCGLDIQFMSTIILFADDLLTNYATNISADKIDLGIAGKKTSTHGK